jgi:hypothetical protein
MHRHGPDELFGPLRGTTAWWRGLGAAPDTSGEGTQVKLRKKGTNRSRHQTDSGIRWELVQRVRQEIDAGTYDCPHRWEQALDRLLERLEQE